MRTILIFILCFGIFVPVAMSQVDRQPVIRLTLKDALQSVDTVNFQVMMASARLEQAIARISQAQADLLPHIEGSLNAGRQTVDLRAEGLHIPIPGFKTHVGPFNSYDARLRVTVALFDPSAFERFQAAKKGQKLSEAELAKTREDVMALVTTLFIDAERKEQTVRIMQILLEKDKMAYSLSEDRLSQGTGTSLDASRYKSELDQTSYLYQQAEQDALDARLDLAAALQLPADVPIIFIDDKVFLKKLENSDAVNFNNATSADMALASSALESHKADQKAAYADFLPKISGRAEYGRSGASPDRGSNVYDVGVAVSVPIWEGGAQQANLKEINGRIKEAQENFLDVGQQVRVNIFKARAAIVETDELRRSKTQQKETAQRTLQMTLRSQAVGSATLLELMQAKADLATAEDQYNEAQAAWIMAHINLLHTQGRLRDLIKGE